MIQSPHLYRKHAPVGTDPRIVERVLEIERSQAGLSVHPVYTLGHLSNLTKVNYSYLRSVIARSIDPYQVFEVRKHRGGVRSIAAPEGRIQHVQRWTLDSIYSQLETHDSSFAYTIGRSAPLAAARHLGAKWLIKLDLKDFFHQIDERQIYRLLRKYRYERLVAFELARLATRLPSSYQGWLPSKYEHSSQTPRYGFAPYWAEDSKLGRLGYLPQGAPSSGAIANAIALGLDRSISQLAARHEMSYTRYADDITLSSTNTFVRRLAGRLIASVGRSAADAGFELNLKKTKILGPGTRLDVLGVLVDGPVLRLTKKTREKIEWHLRGIENNGIYNHQMHARFHDPEGMLNFLSGLIHYARDVDPHLAGEYYRRFNRIDPRT